MQQPNAPDTSGSFSVRTSSLLSYSPSSRQKSDNICRVDLKNTNSFGPGPRSKPSSDLCMQQTTSGRT
eukprot:7549159-Pyramimonas_sp.AAC.1